MSVLVDMRMPSCQIFENKKDYNQKQYDCAASYRSFGPPIDQPADAERRCYKNCQENKFSEHRQILFSGVMKIGG